MSGDLFELFAHFLPYEFRGKRRCQNPRDRKLIYVRAASRLAVSFVQLPAILLCKMAKYMDINMWHAVKSLKLGNMIDSALFGYQTSLTVQRGFIARSLKIGA